MKKINTSSILLLFYFTFSSFSGYSLSIIQEVGKYGKIAILLVTIYFFSIIVINKGLKILSFLTKETLIIYLFGSFVLGSIYGYIVSSNFIYSFYTFYIVLSLLFVIIISINNNYNINIFHFFKIVESILIFQFIIGLLLIIVLNINLYDVSAGGLSNTQGGLSGFLEKRNTFGLMCAVGFFSSLYVYKISKSKKSLFLLVTYLILIYLTKTRFVYIIILSFVSFSIYFLILEKIKNGYIKIVIYIIKVAVTSFLLFSIYFFIINNQEIVYEFTTGRVLVWGLFIEEIQSDLLGLTIGHGSTYFSDLIIDKHGKYNYYISILDSLSLHSSYLKLLETGGIISLILFIYINLKALQKSNTYSNWWVC